jgi:transposase
VTFPTELKVKIILLMAKHEHPAEVQRILRIDNSKIVPHVNGIKKLFTKFCQTGSVHSLPRSGRPRRSQISDDFKQDANTKTTSEENVKPEHTPKVCPKCEEVFEPGSELKTRKRFRRRAGKMYEFYKAITGESCIPKDEKTSEQSESSDESSSENSDSYEEGEQSNEDNKTESTETKKKALRVPLALDIKIRIVLLMAKLESPLEVQKTFKREKSSIIPSKNTIYRAFRKFCQTGSVIDQVKRQPRKLDEAKINQIKLMMANRASSLAEISNNIGMSRTSLFKIRQFYDDKEKTRSKGSHQTLALTNKNPVKRTKNYAQQSDASKMTIKQLSEAESIGSSRKKQRLAQLLQSEPASSNLSSQAVHVEAAPQCVVLIGDTQVLDFQNAQCQNNTNRIEQYQNESGCVELIEQSNVMDKHFETTSSYMPLETIEQPFAVTELQSFTSTFSNNEYSVNLDGTLTVDNSFSAPDQTFCSSDTLQTGQNWFNDSSVIFRFDNEFC